MQIGEHVGPSSRRPLAKFGLVIHITVREGSLFADILPH
jgi:hypothetical protein